MPLAPKKTGHYHVRISSYWHNSEKHQLSPSTTMGMIFRIAALLAVLLSHAVTTADGVEVVSNCMR
jgi:hypothetical protein